LFAIGFMLTFPEGYGTLKSFVEGETFQSP